MCFSHLFPQISAFLSQFGAFSQFPLSPLLTHHFHNECTLLPNISQKKCANQKFCPESTCGTIVQKELPTFLAKICNTSEERPFSWFFPLILRIVDNWTTLLVFRNKFHVMWKENETPCNPWKFHGIPMGFPGNFP